MSGESTYNALSATPFGEDLSHHGPGERVKRKLTSYRQPLACPPTVVGWVHGDSSVYPAKGSCADPRIPLAPRRGRLAKKPDDVTADP